MRYIEALETINFVDENVKSLFLAGGITGCSEWQKEMADELVHTDLIVVNPRRANFPMNDPKAARKQIEWEHHALNNCDMVSFWFDKHTVQPITLFELGRWSTYSKKDHIDLFVGIHPEYPRRQDVEIQMSLEQPDVKIVYSIDDLVEQIIWQAY